VRQCHDNNSVVSGMYIPVKQTAIQCLLFLVVVIPLLFIVILFSRIAQSDDSDHHKLSQLQKKINLLQSELEKDNQQKDRAVFDLKVIEKSIAEASQNLRIIQHQLADTQRKHDALIDRQLQLRQQMAVNRNYIIEQTRTAYALGNQEYIKLLLNQQDPSRVARIVVYYQYFNRSRMDRLNEITTNLQNLTSLEQDISRDTEQLTQLQHTAVQNKNILQSRREQRQQVVAMLTSELKKKDNSLQALLRDEQHLKQLLNQIQDLTDVQLDLAPPKEFSQLKGQLSWPTRGKLIASFGSNRENTGNVKWQGTLIQTTPGQSVRAIAYGRVVFADWLRGFGMLLIVDHGKGYMSLYGQNEQLYKKIGDWVQADEVIAATGNSGGHNTISLYFEIRHNGVPINPAKWCKSLPDIS